MNAIDLLETQHKEVARMFDELESVDGDEKLECFHRIADALAIHASIEEKHFYPAVKAKRTEDILLESLEEHLAIKRVLADLLKLDVTDEAFIPKCTVLREEVEHHVKEERADLFPKVHRLLGKRRLEQLGAAMEEMVQDLEDGEPRNAVLSETDHAPAL